MSILVRNCKIGGDRNLFAARGAKQSVALFSLKFLFFEYLALNIYL